jgi:hypothetical protein
LRRSFIAALLVTIFSFLALVRADAQTPIRVGFMTTKTGPLAAIGLQMETGLLQFLKGEELPARRPQGRALHG